MDKTNFRKWLLMAPLGLVLVGAGLCVFGEALLMKYNNAPFWDWFWWGTGGLAIINAGISVVGKAIIHRIRYERAQ